MSQILEAAAAAAAAPAATPETVPAAATPPAPTTPPETTTTPGEPAKALEPLKGAPEKYGDFKVPEGITLDKAVVDRFHGVAKTANLTQDQAQALVDFQMATAAEQQAATDAFFLAEKAALPGLIAKDPELGGANAVANLAAMQRAIVAFGDPKLTKFLDSPYTSSEAYLAFARFALKVGNKVKEDSVTGTGPEAGKQTGWTAEEFYAKAQKPTQPNATS